MMDEIASQIRIERPLYEHHQLREDFYYEKPNKSLKLCKDELKTKDVVVGFIPVVGWLLNYRWKTDIISDIISGITVAIMHIPQGMAYALLGNVPPVVGIYMAFFPVLVYFMLGTSKHNSMGTFAIVCLMTGKAVLQHSDPIYFSQSSNTPMNITDATGYSPIQVATAVTFTAAMFQIAMYALRLGAVSALLSETLISGFTTGAAIQVLISQIKDLCGLKIPKFKGYFVNVYTVISIFTNITELNNAAVVISFVTILVSSLNNEILKPRLAKKCLFPLPIELIVVVLGTLISRYCHLEETYHISVVGDIPLGLPQPALPQFSLIEHVLVDGFTIAIVSYTITLSMALIFAQKLDYEVDANQELLALGTGNIFGSFFSCMPVCASLSRSLIQQVVGGKTQIASVVSCGILVVILLLVGPFFEPLPKSVLAGVIVVALKGMLMQMKAVVKFWKLSRMDAIVWTATCLTVVFVSIDIGLLVGIIMSLVSIFVLSFKPHTCLLGSVPGTEIYLDIKRYKGVREIEGIKIFHYCGGVNFATKNIFKSELIRLLEINPQKEVIYRAKLAKYLKRHEVKPETTNNISIKVEKLQSKVNTDLRCIILDFSSVSYFDPSGVSMLKGIIESFTKLNIPVYIAACPEPVYEMITKCNLIGDKPTIKIYLTVHDAVHCSTQIFCNSATSNMSRIQLQ